MALAVIEAIFIVFVFVFVSAVSYMVGWIHRDLKDDARESEVLYDDYISNG